MKNDYHERLYDALKEFIQEKSKYSPYVLKKAKESCFPLVVFSVTDNSSIANLGYYEQISMLTISVEISAINKEVDGEEIDAMIIANEIHDIVNEFLTIRCGLNRTYDSPTANVDTNVYRIVMRFTKKINITKNLIY